MGRASNLVDQGFSDSSRKRVRSSASRTRVSDGFSGRKELSDDPERIESYIQDFYLDNIIDLASGRDAVDSLKNDSTVSPLGDDDFKNLLKNAGVSGEEEFAEWLFEKYGVARLEKIEEEDIELKSGKKRRGFRINREIYLIKITTKTGKEFSQARSFKTGRVVKLDRNIRRIIDKKK